MSAQAQPPSDWFWCVLQGRSNSQRMWRCGLDLTGATLSASIVRDSDNAVAFTIDSTAATPASRIEINDAERADITLVISETDANTLDPAESYSTDIKVDFPGSDSVDYDILIPIKVETPRTL